MSNKRKNRNKKFNPTKRLQRAVPAVLKSMSAVAVRLQTKVSDDKSKPNTILYNCKTAKPYSPNERVQSSLISTRMKWAVYACAICVDDAGSPYHTGYWTVANEHYYFHDLQDYVADMVEQACEEATTSHVIDAAWVAVPWNEEITDKQLIEIFINYGAYDERS